MSLRRIPAPRQKEFKHSGFALVRGEPVREFWAVIGLDTFDPAGENPDQVFQKEG
jgi:hypothetical protein